jgi:hypothetical protein
MGGLVQSVKLSIATTASFSIIILVNAKMDGRVNFVTKKSALVTDTKSMDRAIVTQVTRVYYVT